MEKRTRGREIKGKKEAFNMLWGCKGLYSIFSNPSFEVWFVLHFKNAPYGLSAGKMKDHLKKLVEDKYPDYSETTDLYDYLLDKQQDALKRSRALHKIQSENFDTVYSHESNPYTDMFSFIEYMEEIKARNC